MNKITYYCSLITVLAMLLMFPALAFSAEPEAGTLTNTYKKSFGEQLFEDPSAYSRKFLVFGGYHQHLYGYTDVRYVGDDKGDYIKTDSEQAGMEFYMTNFSSILSILEGGGWGANISFYRHGEIKARDLPLINFTTDPDIPAETVPADINDRVSKFWLNMGVFLCYHMKWYATDLGITVVARAFDEKYREKYNPADPDGDPIMVEGRGLIWDNPKVYPNFHLRLGAENIPHFTFDIFRGDYDARYGVIQTKLVIPVHALFTMKVGAYLYKTNAFFLEPTMNWEGISVGFKFGSIMNYRDKHIERTGIVDSFFYAGSVAYQW